MIEINPIELTGITVKQQTEFAKILQEQGEITVKRRLKTPDEGHKLLTQNTHKQ